MQSSIGINASNTDTDANDNVPKGWHLLFDRYYRLNPLYPLQWGHAVDFRVSKVVAAPFGGPLAVVKDRRAALEGGGGRADGSEKEIIRIYTAAGQLIAEIIWDGGFIVGLSWTGREQLVVVASDGMVALYSMQGERINTFPALPQSSKSDGVADVDFWPDGLVLRTGLKSELWAINNWNEPRPFRLAQPNLAQPPASMVVNGAGSKCELLLATAGGSILCVDATSSQDQMLTTGPFARMVLSPSGSLLAALNDDGTLHVMSTDFKTCLSKFSTGASTPPTQMIWCGEEALLLTWPHTLLLVGLLGDYVHFPMTQPFTCVSEFDGARIYTNAACEWMARVPQSTESIFRNDSTSSAAQLYDAQQAFEDGDAAADDNLRALAASGAEGMSGGNTLKDAIEQCLDAAAHEFDYEQQRALLKAASYGKLVCPSFPADEFVDMCRILRVLNAVRSPQVGLPLSYEQYMKMDAELLVERLITRHQHLLAMRICEYLRMHPERVLVHWACEKIKHCDDVTDQEMGEMIVKKLSLCPGISYANIASTAFRHGRRRLATLLLEYEPLASDQVPLLMSMKEDELALNKAIQSGDTDLVYLALMHLKKHRRQKEFFVLIKDKPLARDLYIAYCKQADLPALKSFYYSLQKPAEAAEVAVLEAYQCDDLKDRLQGLQLAFEFFEKDKSNMFAARATEEEMTLLRMQKELETSTSDTGYVDLSVTQVMEKLISKGDSRHTSKLKTMLKVSDRRLWYMEVQALSRSGCWDELARLVSSKKAPPIGFQPFIEACITHNNLAEASKYIARLPEYHEQMEWLCNIGYWDAAVDIAGRERDVDALMLLQSRCRQPMVQEKIQKLMALIAGQGGR